MKACSVHCVQCSDFFTVGFLQIPTEAVRHERFQMQGGKNWVLPKQLNANRFFWDALWLEIWSNQICPSLGPNGGSVAMDSADWLLLMVE
jgi:hypothetical protein